MKYMIKEGRMERGLENYGRERRRMDYKIREKEKERRLNKSRILGKRIEENNKIF